MPVATCLPYLECLLRTVHLAIPAVTVRSPARDAAAARSLAVLGLPDVGQAAPERHGEGIERSWHSAVFSDSVYFAQGKNFATALAMIR
jgi:hypothetical protein